MHSIIISHRDRHEHLRLCAWSLYRSAQCCGIDDWEMVVVDSQSRHALPALGARARLVSDPVGGGVFNKARLLNLGIDAAAGEIITILDVDALVGCRFLEAAQSITPDVPKCCYRVRRIPPREAANLLSLADPESCVEEMFARYETFQATFEAYGNPARNSKSPNGQPWGNSQYSILRDALGTLRYDESYDGHGFEDLDFNLMLAARLGSGYRAHIHTDADHAMLHLDHPRNTAGWNEPAYLAANRLRYRNKRKQLAIT